MEVLGEGSDFIVSLDTHFYVGQISIGDGFLQIQSFYSSPYLSVILYIHKYFWIFCVALWLILTVFCDSEYFPGHFILRKNHQLNLYSQCK